MGVSSVSVFHPCPTRLHTERHDVQGSVHAATFFLWMTLSAASICLVSNMLLLRWFSTHFARTVASAFSDLHECLSIAMDESFNPDGANQNIASQHKRLLDQLLAESVQLDSAYSIAAFELRLGRISGGPFCVSRFRFSKHFVSPLHQASHCSSRKYSQGIIVG